MDHKTGIIRVYHPRTSGYVSLLIHIAFHPHLKDLIISFEPSEQELLERVGTRGHIDHRQTMEFFPIQLIALQHSFELSGETQEERGYQRFAKNRKNRALKERFKMPAVKSSRPHRR